jgi:hypothetical protein
MGFSCCFEFGFKDSCICRVSDRVWNMDITSNIMRMDFFG